MSDFGTDLDQMDMEAFLNMRDWLEKAVTNSGAKITGAGIGAGKADLQFTLEGHLFHVSMQPMNAAPRVSTANSDTAPFHDSGVGQGDPADAAHAAVRGKEEK